MTRAALIALTMVACASSSRSHGGCLPGDTSGPLACPWHDPRVLGSVMPPPDAYPTCGYILWSGPGQDYVVKPRPDDTEPQPCWTTPDRAVRRTFSSKTWRMQHGGPAEIPP